MKLVTIACGSGDRRVRGRTRVRRTTPAATGVSGRGRPRPAPEISAGEIQRLYDAYALVQAQDALQLTDDQYIRFVSRLKTLQETRRRHQQARNQIVQDLRRVANGPAASTDDGVIRGRLAALQAEDERAAAELRKALDGVDEILTVRQQARFRLFEDQMERRKLDLLMRARQNVRNPARRGRGADDPR